MSRAVLVAAFLTAGAGTAAADRIADEESTSATNTRVEAERYAAQAKVQFDTGDYAAAVLGYGEAYRRHPSPGLLFNLAQAYRLNGDCAAATLMYHHYLREVPHSPHRELVDDHLESIETCTYEQTFSTRRAAHGTLIGLGHERRDPGRNRRIAGLTTAGAGVVLAAAGMYFLVDAHRAEEEVSEGYRNGGRWDDVASADARGQRSELVGAVLLGAGGAALATGTTLYLLGRRASHSEAALAVTPTHGGVDARVSWRF